MMERAGKTTTQGGDLALAAGLAIRAPQPADCTPIVLLMRQLGYEVTAGMIDEKLRPLASSPADRLLVATLHGEVVGSISLHAIPLFHMAGCLGRITSLVVDERHRGAGIGSALLAAAECWFSTRGCVKVEVTSSDHRAGAHRFYQRHGYVRDGQRFAKQNSRQ
jgi:GNAT superfamily N-acetyltransferase